MRHAQEKALDQLEPLLKRLRKLPGLRERKRGAFYRGSVAFLHFHEDPAGLFADIKVDGGWQRLKVDTTAERQVLLKAAGSALGLRPA
jgi:hypothetical protein